MVSRTTVIINPAGLHLKPAARFCEEALKYQSTGGSAEISVNRNIYSREYDSQRQKRTLCPRCVREAGR